MAEDSSSYPAALDTFTAPGTNLSGPPTHEDMHLKLADAVAQIQLHLGINPDWKMLNDYANETGRDNEITSPGWAHMAYLRNRNSFTIYDEDASGIWWEWRHQQMGQENTTTDANGKVTVAFDDDFQAAPIIFANVVSTSSDQLTVQVAAQAVDGFDAYIRTNGGPLISSGVIFNWLAFEYGSG